MCDKKKDILSQKNLKYETKLCLRNEPVILNLLEDQDDRVCLQYDRIFCSSKNKERVDPKSKIKQVTQELKRHEAEIRKNKIEKKRLRTLSEQYEHLERQYTN